MPEPTNTQASRVPLKRLAARDEIAETIDRFTGTLN
jgi:hypothetical protein